jgi:hypothetical protein
MPLPFWCYILRCADGSYYTGHTDSWNPGWRSTSEVSPLPTPSIGGQ